MKKQKESDKTKLKTTLAQLKQYQQLGTMSEIQKCFDVLEKYVEIGSVDEFKQLR